MWKSYAIVAVLVAVACAVNFVDLSQAGKDRNEAGPAQVFLSPDCLDLGTVEPQSALKWVVTFQNPTQGDVTVEDLRASCQCTQIEPRSFVIRPGKERECQLTISLVANKKTASAPRRSDFAVDLFAHIRGRIVEDRSWTLHGIIEQQLYFSQDDIFFDEADNWTHGLRFRSKRIEFESNTSLKEVVAVEVPAELSLKAELRDSHHGSVEITPTEFAKGRFSFLPKISGTTAKGRILVPQPLSVRGISVPELKLTPSSIAIAPTTIGETVETDIVVTTYTGRDFKLLAVTPNSTAISVDKPEYSASGQESRRVRVRIPGTGLYSESVTFTGAIGNDPATECSVELPVKYIGQSK